MRLEVRDDIVLVVLSRRNMLALLHKLDIPGSARTLLCADNRVDGAPTRDLHLVVQAEDDESHYAARLAPAGLMHPDTELFLEKHGADADVGAESVSPTSMQLPPAQCPLGYPAAQIEALLSPFERGLFQRWFDGKTTTICDGRRWSESSGSEAASACAADPHDTVILSDDAQRFAAVVERHRRELETRPGVRPRQHSPNRLHAWVFLQHQIWVDYHGNEHEIEHMPPAYVENVIGFCEQQAEQIRTIVDAHEINAVLPAVLALPSTAHVWDQVVDRIHLRHAETAVAWLGTTPLLMALRRRRDGAATSA